jgi:hypothetical protein
VVIGQFFLTFAIVWLATLMLFFAGGRLLIHLGLWPREWSSSPARSAQLRRQPSPAPDPRGTDLRSTANNVVGLVVTSSPQIHVEALWSLAFPRGSTVEGNARI